VAAAARCIALCGRWHRAVRRGVAGAPWWPLAGGGEVGSYMPLGRSWRSWRRGRGVGAAARELMTRATRAGRRA